MDRTVDVIGVPTDFGANRRGVDMGPSAIRYAGLSGQLERAGVDCLDRGDIEVPSADRWTEASTTGTVELGPIEQVCERAHEQVAESLAAGRIPLALGGDHSIAIGTAAGAAQAGDIGVLWLDAHADFNTPDSSPSGNVHGMPLAALTGQGAFADTDWVAAPGVAEARVALVGLRDVDAGERALLASSDVAAYTMSDIDRSGIAQICDEAIERVTTGVEGLHVSLDLDFLDPMTAPGVGTPVRGGVTYREAHHALEQVAQAVHERSLSLSLDLVEVNPIQDRVNETATLATELAASALGQRTLPGRDR